MAENENKQNEGAGPDETEKRLPPEDGANVCLTARAKQPITEPTDEHDGTVVIGMTQFDLPSMAQQKAGFKLKEEHAHMLINQYPWLYKRFKPIGEKKAVAQGQPEGGAA